MGKMMPAQVHSVLEALSRWQQGIDERDLEMVLSVYSPQFHYADSGESVRDYYDRLFNQSELDDYYNSKGAKITIDNTFAYAEPITCTRLRGIDSYRFVFRLELSQWCIFTIERIGIAPIELGLAGLAGDYEEILERWVTANLEWVQRTLRENPANGTNRTLRHQALRMLDEPLHLRSAARIEPVGRFLRENIEYAIEQIASERIAQGATIWKLYNHGWIVRTAHHCWAHDFVCGFEKASITDIQLERLLDQIQVLFCSHWHQDHSSEKVIKRALSRGIPVMVSPFPEANWDNPMRHRIRNIQSADTNGNEFTVIERGADGTIAGLKFHAFPGHQGDITNTVFLVTADGMAIIHSGDQANEDDFTWISTIGSQYEVDVLMVLFWTDDLDRMIEGIRPRVVIPGHENELGHLFALRGSYDESLRKLRRQKTEWHVMTWGERFHIDPLSSCT